MMSNLMLFVIVVLSITAFFWATASRKAKEKGAEHWSSHNRTIKKY